MKMLPIRTKNTTRVYKLPGGDESNDLPIEDKEGEHGETVLCSVWNLSDAERKTIADGGFVELMIWGSGHPPVALAAIADDEVT
jgi:hypothetical protein